MGPNDPNHGDPRKRKWMLLGIVSVIIVALLGAFFIGQRSGSNDDISAAERGQSSDAPSRATTACADLWNEQDGEPVTGPFVARQGIERVALLSTGGDALVSVGTAEDAVGGDSGECLVTMAFVVDDGGGFVWQFVETNDGFRENDGCDASSLCESMTSSKLDDVDIPDSIKRSWNARLDTDGTIEVTGASGVRSRIDAESSDEEPSSDAVTEFETAATDNISWLDDGKKCDSKPPVTKLVVENVECGSFDDDLDQMTSMRTMENTPGSGISSPKFVCVFLDGDQAGNVNCVGRDDSDERVFIDWD